MILPNFSFAILLSGILGGYLIADYPQPYLDKLTTPFGQFIVIFFIFYVNGTFGKEDRISLAFLLTLLSVFILQIVKILLWELQEIK